MQVGRGRDGDAPFVGMQVGGDTGVGMQVGGDRKGGGDGNAMFRGVAALSEHAGCGCTV